MSTIASNLAYILAEESETAILDLVLDFGSVSDFLNFTPRPRIDTIPSSGFGDPSFLTQLSLPKRKNLKVFAAPDSTAKQFDLKKLLDNCRRTFKYTVIDLPHALLPDTVSALAAADLILAVSEYNWASILSMAVFLHDLDMSPTGLKSFAPKTKLVINKYEWLPQDVLDECKKNLKFPIEQQLPLDKTLLDERQLAGSGFLKVLKKLTTQIGAQ